MKIVIIIPAFNEEEFLPITLDSIAVQTRIPNEVIVVNDNSTDNTPTVIDQYADRYSWIRRVDSNQEARHAPGAKVVNAFYQGFHQISVPDWEVVFKLDADIELPPNYCERIIRYYEEDPEVGLAGGILQIPDDLSWKVEQVADLDHLRGALKAYRRACFEQMKGIRRAMGWDTTDELLARYYGWKVVVDPELMGKHYRITGKKTGSLKVQIKSGKALYRMRYGIGIALLSAAKIGWTRHPIVLSGFYLLLGYLEGLIRREHHIVDPDQGKFIRQYRLERMKNKLMGKN